MKDGRCACGLQIKRKSRFLEPNMFTSDVLKKLSTSCNSVEPPLTGITWSNHFLYDNNKTWAAYLADISPKIQIQNRAKETPEIQSNKIQVAHETHEETVQCNKENK